MIGAMQRLRALGALAQALPAAPPPAFSLTRCWATDATAGDSGGDVEASAHSQQSKRQEQQLLRPQQERLITIDRSGLARAGPHSHGPSVAKQPETELTKHMKSLIRFRGGPITVAEYMSEVLTNPVAGYYTLQQQGREVFGLEGDFVTSPEVSQLFGEMVGIWAVATWQQLGSPGRLRLVELGPGRGTLMADLLRATRAFPAFSGALDVHLVEVSDPLRQRQFQALQCRGDAPADGSIAAGTSRWNGCAVTWHRALDDVPVDAPVLYICHEFFDALPVHQFQIAPNGRWRERLVDIDSDDSSPYHLRMVLAPKDTPATRLALRRRLDYLTARDAEGAGQLQALEVSPQCMATAQALAARVAAHGGAALVIDYGQDGPYADSLQAIRRHDVVPLLDAPGSADLSAWVDFDALRQAVEEGGTTAACYGPITQQQFLLSLGIGTRLESLIDVAADDEAAAALEAGCRRLVEGEETDGMGGSYKAFVIAQADAQPPVPFAATSSEHGTERAAC